MTSQQDTEPRRVIATLNYERSRINRTELRQEEKDRLFLELEDHAVQALTSWKDKEVKKSEVLLRHKIANEAPPCEHSLASEKDHQAYCGFINNIWLNWAIKNGASIQPDGSASLQSQNGGK